MVLVANPSTERNSMTKTSISNILVEDIFLWLTLDLTLMDHNFSLISLTQTGQMENTLFLLKSLKDQNSQTFQNPRKQVVKINQLKTSSFQTVVKLQMITHTQMVFIMEVIKWETCRIWMNKTRIKVMEITHMVEMMVMVIMEVAD